MHECEELDLDLVPFRAAGWHDRKPSNEKRSLAHLEAELLCDTAIEGLRNIRLLHESIMDNNAMKISFEMFDLDALIGGDTRNMLGRHILQRTALQMEDLIVLEIVEQRHRREGIPHLVCARQIDRGARNPGFAVLLRDERRERN